MTYIIGKLTNWIRKAGAIATCTLLSMGFYTMANAGEAKEVVARMSIHWSPTHPANIQTVEFVRRVNERAEGKLRIELFPSGQLFGIRDILGAVASGSVEIGGAVGVVSFPTINKDYYVSTIPGYFNSFEHQRGFFRDSEVGKKIWDDIMNKAGIVVIANNPVGPTATFSTNENLDTVESLIGHSARILASTDRIRWKALGARKMVSISTREVYMGLQNGMIDAVTTVPVAVKAYSWWETLNAVQLPYLTYNDAYFIVNAGWYNSLTPELQGVLTTVGAEISKESTDAIMSASNAAIDEFKSRGGHVFTLNGAELEKMQKIQREKMNPRYAKLLSPGVFEAVKTYAGE